MQLFSRQGYIFISVFLLLGLTPSNGAHLEDNKRQVTAQLTTGILPLNHTSTTEQTLISLINPQPPSTSPLSESLKTNDLETKETTDPATDTTTDTTTATEIKTKEVKLGRPAEISRPLSPSNNAVTTPAATETTAQDPMELAELIKQRKIYQSAYSALKKGQRKTFRRHYNKLTSYPLKPYLRYYELRRYISSLDTPTINEFVQQNPDLAVTPFLKVAWLKHLAKQGKWQEYLAFYQPSGNTHLHCHSLWARLKTGDQSALTEVKPLWLTGKSQPKACDPLFNAWKASNHFDRDYIWQRFELAMEARKLGLATYLSNSFSGKEAALAQDWIRIHRNPRRLSSTKHYLTDSDKSNVVVLNGLIRLVSKSPEEAIALWAVYESALSFTEPQQQKFSQALATILALRFHPTASEWLTEANPIGDNTKLNELAIRVALREQRWNEVTLLIQQLPQTEKNTPQWQYWYARALKKLNISPAQNVEADLIFLQLAQSTDYYGFMAKEQSKLPFQFNPVANSVSDDDLTELERIPAIQRAREFYLLARPSDARREWAAAITTLTDAQRLVAATLASQWGWHNQSIRSVAKSSLHHHLDLRYPRAFQEPVNYFAKSNELSNDWVYAIARQESLFTPDARSPAGALGMMQILPSTAKLVAKQIGARYQGKQDLLQPKKNIRLGTSYMRQLLNQFNENTVLATAAYNAGPHRVKRWLPEDADLPADIWIETIPYFETRHYVKKVLTNQVIYKYQLGRKPELATSIPPIYSPPTDS